jgi:hypothetical protein
MKKQTAVEWLALRYHHRQGYLSQDDIAEAKEMEKQQIKFAYNDGACEILEDKYRQMEDYFNETYNK